MKMCASCQVKVDEIYEHCPLCQNGLEEHDTNNGYPYFPRLEEIKTISMFYKVQLFIAVMICAVCFLLDFLLNARGEKHWSVVVFIWVLSVEALIKPLFGRRTFPVSFVTNAAVIGCIATLINSLYMERISVGVNIVIPIVALCVMVFNFIAALIDKGGNALVYSICNIWVTLVPPVIMLIMGITIPVLWKVCILTCVVSFIGLIIFKGAVVFTEVQKRLHI